MLLSGPAGGVTGAVWVAEQCGYRDLITFDMGGTSTDVALVQDLTPRIGRETKVGDLTVRASSVDVRTVGAGGGSIAHVPRADQGAAGRPAVRRRRPGPGRLRQGRHRAHGHRRQRRPRLPALVAGRRRDHPRRRRRPRRGRQGRRGHGPGVTGGRGRRHRRHRQREHARRPAAGLGAAGLRPARLRARRLRRRRPAARQRARQAHRGLAGHRAAVPGRALRPRRRDHQPPRRVRPHGAAPVRRPQRRRPGRASCASSPTTPGSGWPTRACRGRSRRSPTRSTSATTGRASRSRSSSTRPGWTTPDGAFGRLGETFDAEHNRLFSFLLDVDHELVNARATVTGPKPDVAPVHLEQGDGDPRRALVTEHPIHVGGAAGDRRTSTTGRSCAPAT